MQTLYQSLVAVEPATLVVTILNLFLQLYILKKFFLNKVLGILDQRRATAQEDITAARTAREEADAFRKASEATVQQASQEASNILDTAQKSARQQKDEILRDAREQAVQIKRRADADIAREKRKAVNEAKDEISSLAVTIAEKIIGSTLDQKDHQALVDGFIAQLGDGI